MTLRLRTFGAVCLERYGVAWPCAPAQRRRLALLAYLAAAADAPVTRDKLMGLFWPERPDHSARHSLSQLLYALRPELPPDALITSADEVRLDRDRLPSDLNDFLDAIRASEDQRAVEVYRGPFLDGFFVDDAPEFERWAETERARLAGWVTAALERLADVAEDTGDRFRALNWCQRWVELDRTNAQAVLQLMNAQIAVGD